MTFINSLFTFGHGVVWFVGVFGGYILHWWQTSTTVATLKADAAAVELKISAGTAALKADVAAIKVKVGM